MGTLFLGTTSGLVGHHHTVSIIINSQLQGSRELSSPDDRRTNTLILDWQIDGSLWEEKIRNIKFFFYIERPGSLVQIIIVKREGNSRR